MFSVCKEVVSQQDGRCCKDHLELGHCAPGKDDDPNGGKCWTYCITECSKGGLCKKLSGGHHVCHCYCWSYAAYEYNMNKINL